jgi:hypothetical protein
MIPSNIKNNQGITGDCHIKWKETWKVEIEDDEGTRRSIKIPNFILQRFAILLAFATTLESADC